MSKPNKLPKALNTLLITLTVLLFLFDVGIAWIALGVVWFYLGKGRKEPRSRLRLWFVRLRRVVALTLYICILIFLIQPWHQAPRIPEFTKYVFEPAHIDSSFDLTPLLQKFPLDSSERAMVRMQFREKEYTDTLFNMIKRAIDLEEFEKVTWYSQDHIHYREGELFGPDDLLHFDIHFLITKKNRKKIEPWLWGIDPLSQEQVIIINMVLLQAELIFQKQKNSDAIRHLKLAIQLIKLSSHGSLTNKVSATKTHCKKMFTTIETHLHSISDSIHLKELLTIIDECRISEKMALTSFQSDLYPVYECIGYRAAVSENKFSAPFKLPFQRKLYDERYTRRHFDYFTDLALSYISEESEEKRDSIQLIIDDLKEYHLDGLYPFFVPLSHIIQGNFLGRRSLEMLDWAVDVQGYRENIVQHEESVDRVSAMIEERLENL